MLAVLLCLSHHELAALHSLALSGMPFHPTPTSFYQTLMPCQPTIITNLGYTAASAQLLTVPPYALATLLTVGFAMVSEKAHRRAPFIVFSSSLSIIGYIILLTNKDPTHRPGVSYVGMFFAAAGIYPSTAMVLSWPANNVSGQTKRATANAMQISIGNLGAVMGTQLYRPAWAPRYFVGHGMALAYMCANIVVVLTTWYVLQEENKRRDALESRVGLPDDMSEEWKGDEDLRWRFTV